MYCKAYKSHKSLQDCCKLFCTSKPFVCTEQKILFQQNCNSFENQEFKYVFWTARKKTDCRYDSNLQKLIKWKSTVIFLFH